MEHLLFLVHRIPYPPNKGDKVRSFHLLKYLANTYQIHVGAFVDDPADWQYAQALGTYSEDVHLEELKPSYAKLYSMTGLLTGKALTLPYYKNRHMAKWVGACLNAYPIKRILVFSSSMAQYVPRETAVDTKCVIDFVDVDSDKWLQYAKRKSWPMNWIYRRESHKLFAYEQDVARSFNASVFVSGAEATLFREMVPDVSDRITNVNNGVDLDYFSRDVDHENPYGEDGPVLAFTGAMDYWANVDAVTWFSGEVFPRIRAHHPLAKFYIVGARPSPEVNRLAEQPGIRVTGTVDDIRPYIVHAYLAVAPMRIARGVQNKVLESFALGRPVVATSQALEGLDPQPGLTDRSLDEAEEMAESINRMLAEPNGVDDQGDLCRQYVERHYNWELNLRRMVCLLEDE